MDIPIPSPLIQYTLVSPWVLCLALLLVAFIITPILHNTCYITGLRRFGLIAAVFLSGPLFIGLAYLIETPAEQIDRLTVEFVDAAVAGDQSTVDMLLALDLQIVVGNELSTLTRTEAIASVSTLPMLIPTNTVLKCTAGMVNPEVGVSRFSQLSQIAYGSPIPNTWHCQWQRNSDGGWEIIQLTWLKWGIDDQIPSLRMLRFP